MATNKKDRVMRGKFNFYTIIFPEVSDRFLPDHVACRIDPAKPDIHIAEGVSYITSRGTHPSHHQRSFIRQHDRINRDFTIYGASKAFLPDNFSVFFYFDHPEIFALEMVNIPII